MHSLSSCMYVCMYVCITHLMLFQISSGMVDNWSPHSSDPCQSGLHQGEGWQIHCSEQHVRGRGEGGGEEGRRGGATIGCYYYL